MYVFVDFEKCKCLKLKSLPLKTADCLKFCSVCSLTRFVQQVSWYFKGNCDFENGMCTWTNPGGIDDFDWLLGKGSTGTTYTGPAADHTLGNASGK